MSTGAKYLIGDYIEVNLFGSTKTGIIEDIITEEEVIYVVRFPSDVVRKIKESDVVGLN